MCGFVEDVQLGSRHRRKPLPKLSELLQAELLVALQVPPCHWDRVSYSSFVRLPWTTCLEAWHNCFMRRRRLMIAGVILLAITATIVRIRHHKLGWGSYWSVDFIAPWHQ
jgi:ABC-type transport system involved in cytochrome c biogenesis permease subunit